MPCRCSGEFDLSGYPVALGGWEVLSRIIGNNEAISKLKFCDCMIPPLGFDLIFNALMNSNVISELNLFGNNMNSTSVIQLGKMLSINKSIKILTLNWNNIGESLEAFSAFCGGLSQNESLEYLDLRNNQISSADANELSAALQQNHSLKFLDLRWNKLKNKGVDCLQNALKYNVSIQELLLKGNFVHFHETTSIELCVKKNEEVHNVKMEYELKVAFLLKELKKLEDMRVQQISKIMQISQQRFMHVYKILYIVYMAVEFENKFEEFSQLLMKKEEQLTCQKFKKMTADKQTSRMMEKVAKLKEELECSIRKSQKLEKTLEEKQNDYFTSIKELECKLKLEKDCNEKLVKDINDKNIVLEDLKNDIIKAKLEWESCTLEKIGKIENQWKIKLEDLENKYSKYIVELREQLVEKELMFLKEEEEKMKKFRIRAEEAEKRKLSMEGEMLSLLDKTANQEARMVELQKELTLISAGYEATQKDLENARIEINKYMEALNKVNDDLIKANQTIKKLKTEIIEEKEKFWANTLKQKKANQKIAQMKEEEKLRSELLASALKRYLKSAED
ncbi:leucine-rich repeat-containing protein 45 isoform X3 [Halyomorpha halys]|uniref:leucine-rich repeat-containing protein 45 isoform X3 n=1 Tax=Halyomorpha halys TaxID=286706 RepID=UPI0006D4EC44|nr:leucine-rich repeat-containing protein 45-like isoform X3 [Halyomorpha halys]